MKKVLLNLILLCSFISIARAQAPTNQDCIGAIPLCSNKYETEASYSGTGNIQNEIDGTKSCLRSGEKNDVWYIFTVQKSGNLSFTISPKDGKDDYDWAVFNLTNASCSEIFTNPELSVSCDYAPNKGCNGLTGPNGNTNPIPGATEQCWLQNKPVIPVLAGETYVINVSNYSSTQSGYTIDFSASTADIYDKSAPRMQTLTIPPQESVSVISLRFSENLLCNSIDPSDFVLTGPGGTYTVTSISGATCAAGAGSGNTFELSISPAIVATGTYTLSLKGAITDQCGNTATTGTITSFYCHPGVKPKIRALSSATICAGGSVQLSSNISAVQWLRNNKEIAGATSSTYTATLPGIYTARPITDCTQSDGITVVSLPSSLPKPVISAPSTYLCNGGSILIEGPVEAMNWYRSDSLIAKGKSISVNVPGVYRAAIYNDCTESPKSDPVYITVNPLAYKKSRFDDATVGEIGTDTASFLGESRTIIADQVKTAGEASADEWIERLAPGLAGRPDSASKCEELKAKLIEVCIAGGDMDHPSGSSTSPVPSASGYSSFGEVIKGVLNISQYTADLNPWLIDAPYPYNAKAQATDVQIAATDSLLCDKLQQLKNEHQTHKPQLSFYAYLKETYHGEMTLSEEELDMLLKSCGSCNYILKEDIRLPVFMQVATKGCISADEFNEAEEALKTEFGSRLSETHAKYPLIYENFLNHRFGFTLTYDQYRTYADTIASAPEMRAQLLCNTPAFEDLELDGYSPVKNLMAVSVANALRQFDEYILEEKRKFKNNYVGLCASANPVVKLEASQRTYHYTLYYYDQADNLVRTVPQEGVSLLSRELLPWVAEARENTCAYDGPLVNSDKNQALHQLADVFESGQGRSIEMWLYNAQINNKQFLATTPDKKYMLQAAFYNGKLNTNIYSLEQDSLNPGAISIIRSHYATADLDAIKLKAYTHLVIQSDSLTKGALQLFVNGEPLQVLPDSLSAGPGFEITGSANLPESLADIKQLRFYSRKLSAAEVATNAKSLCFEVSPYLKEALLTSPRGWYRFNIPTETESLAGTEINERAVSPIYPEHRLATTYSYNSTNQVVKQHTPDGGTSRFWYDNLSRLVISQNDKQLKGNDFSYTAYDKIGRIIEVGQKNYPASGLKEPSFIDSLSYRHFLAGGANSQIVQTFYDTIPEPGGGIIPLQQENLRKRVSISAYRETASSPISQASYYSYDQTGNVTTLWQQVHGLGLKQIDYEFDQVSGKVNFVRYQDGKPDQFYYQYKYDAENRLTGAWSGTKVLTNPVAGSYLLNGKQDAEYEYYLHGPLARIELGDQYGKVQGLDYAYTLQGWLKGVNSQRLDPLNDIGRDGISGSAIPKDVYGYSLGYYRGDYKAIGGKGAPAFGIQYQAQTGDITGQDLYNGNIANTTLAIDKLSGGGITGYSYRYDQLNRLTQMRQHPIDIGSGTWGAPTDAYKESISYDANGNILSYLRNGGANQAEMDKLTYAYQRDSQGHLLSNRLMHVKDAVSAGNYDVDIDSQPDSNYRYDEIGNLVKDTQEGINAIDWTVYGKISRIQKSNGKTISYAYDPAGNRVGKTVDGLMTWYVRDAQGNTLGVYDNQNCVSNWREQQLYGSSRLGIWKPNRSLYSKTDTAAWDSVGNKYYELTNHLGNVLAVISNKKYQIAKDSLVDKYEADVVSAKDYYPFGMTMPGRSFSSGSYRYGFNGKENDNEVRGEGNQQDYGMRIYDPRSGRWLSIDAVTKPFSSPYTFSGNNPINYLDPDGQDEIHFIDKVVRQYYDGKLICSKATKYSIVIKNNEPNVFVHHKVSLRYDGIGRNAKISGSTPINTKFYPDLPGHFSDRKTLIKYIDEYHLSRQDVDYGYSEISSPGSVASDRLKKSQWWGSVFSDKKVQDENERIDNINKNFVITGLSFIGPELIAAKLASNGLWLGRLAQIGDDVATTNSVRNLVPKRGWFDVVVHGDPYYVGNAFNVGGKTLSVQEVYTIMLENGYKSGTPIRLISCDAGRGVAAQSLADIAGAKVIAPTAKTLVTDAGKIITEDGSKYQVFKPGN